MILKTDLFVKTVKADKAIVVSLSSPYVLEVTGEVCAFFVKKDDPAGFKWDSDKSRESVEALLKSIGLINGFKAEHSEAEVVLEIPQGKLAAKLVMTEVEPVYAGEKFSFETNSATIN